ncbi:MAG: hypothetical protein IJT96_01530 [Lachnospiraceae bacterium]|nr:hypothetical protein [Lachnospiraceae bacterium]
MIVIYTADVRKGSTKPILDLAGMTLSITEGFLSELKSKEIRDELTTKIEAGEPFTEEDMMKLAIYPLTYRVRSASRKP